MENVIAQGKGAGLLVSVVQRLSLARDLPTIVDIVKRAARELTGADGATFVLKEEGFCHYVDEDAIGPLWKGKRFPLKACVSGWAMHHRKAAVIPDIYRDSRVPVDAYRPTFVKSMVMVPIRQKAPIGAIGNYWAFPRQPTREEVALLQSLADSTSIAIENVSLLADLKSSLRKERKAHWEVERQLSLRDEFICIAAHELKTPLTPVLIQMSSAERALQRGNTEKPLEMIATSKEQLARFAHLIDNLLDLSRIRLGRLEVSPEPGVDLRGILEGVAGQLQCTTNARIRVRAFGDVSGRWDPLRIGQVAYNLLSNAIRYGNGKPVLLGAARRDGAVEVFCRDHGIGMSEEAKGRVFGRFERAAPVASYGGLGLGLFISQEIVHRHGGRILVESEPGRGSTFRIFLPVGESAALEEDVQVAG